MWRAFFMAFGINLIIIGAQCLVVESVIVSKPTSAKTGAPTQQDIYSQASYDGSNYSSNTAPARKTFKPKDWMPWSLLAGGIVIVIYTRTFGNR